MITPFDPGGRSKLSRAKLESICCNGEDRMVVTIPIGEIRDYFPPKRRASVILWVGPNYLRKFDIMRRSLKEFIDNPTLPTEVLSSKMLNNYTHSLVKSGIENSTIKGYLKRIKRVIRYANEHLNTKIDLSFDQIDQLKDKANFVVFLDKAEVEMFASVYTITPGELEVKNGFLFRCYQQEMIKI